MFKLGKHFNKYSAAILLTIIAIGAFFRFYNLLWDEGYFMHPDERNIGYAITSLNFAEGDYNPNFFAYGSLPIYIVYLFAGNNFEDALYYGRIISATLSTLIIPMAYLITLLLINGKKALKVLPNKYGVHVPAMAAAAITAFAPGLIQFAHYATFEIFLTFFYMLATIFALIYLRNPRLLWLGLTAAAVGTSIAIKIVSASLLPILILLPLAASMAKLKLHDSRRWLLVLKGWLLNWRMWVSFLVAAACAYAFSPYNVHDSEAFRASMNYEGPVADGSLSVSYTQQFQETTPVVYQATRIFPYIFGVIATVLAVLGAVHIVLSLIGQGIDEFYRVRKIHHWQHLIVLLILSLYTFAHFTLFVKWSRYMIPPLPFMAIIAAYYLWVLAARLHKVNWRFGLIVSVCMWQFILGINFFYIYTQPDPRVAAATWAQNNLDTTAPVLSELYDFGIVPFNGIFGHQNINIYDFYNHDINDHIDRDGNLKQLMADSQYIIMPSNRVYPVRYRLKDKYPKTYKHYNDLFSLQTEYTLIAKFNRKTLFQTIGSKLFGSDSTPYFSYSPSMFESDESHRVFDAPEILIFSKGVPRR